MNDNARQRANRSTVAEQSNGADSLTIIAWALRLPLLRERIDALAGSTPGVLAELTRLTALIAEGERVLGILPPEGAAFADELEARAVPTTDLIGTDPDFTGGMPSGEYVRKLRDG